jgi:hypothetical protein
MTAFTGVKNFLDSSYALGTEFIKMGLYKNGVITFGRGGDYV